MAIVYDENYLGIRIKRIAPEHAFRQSLKRYLTKTYYVYVRCRNEEKIEATRRQNLDSVY